MNDEQLQAWLDQHGGEVGRKDNERDTEGPADPNTGVPTKQRSIDSTTITAKDGATLTLRRNPGPYVGSAQTYTVVENTPAKPGTATGGGRNEPDREGPEGTPIKDAQGTITGYDNSQPVWATHWPDGRITYRPLTGPERQQWERDKNGGKTDAESRPQTGEVRQPVPNRPGWTSITRKQTQNGNTTETTVYVGPDGKEVPTLPAQNDDTATTVTINGQTYIRHTVKKPDGTSEVYHTDQQGNRVSLPNLGPDQPSVPGPTMPQIVLGSSQEALRTYKRELQEGVAAGRWSQKWADDRWAEALQVADRAVQEAATNQRERESTRNAEINLAQSRATYGQNALTMALDHVNKINGLLPEGSNLGGQTFAALLGLNMLMQARSGLDTVNPSGARPTTLSGGDLNNAQAVSTARAEIAAQTAQVAAERANPTTPPPSQPAGPAGAAASATRPSPAAGASAAPASPAMPAPSPYGPGIDSPPVGGYGAASVPPQAEAEPAVTPSQDTAPIFSPVQGAQVPNMKQEPAQPDYGQPGMRVIPQPSPPSSYGEAGDTMGKVLPDYPVLNQYAPVRSPMQTEQSATTAPGQEWGVLKAYAQPTVAPAEPASQPTQYPAAMASEAAAMPVWRMTPDQIAAYQQAGVPDDVIFSPGRRVA